MGAAVERQEPSFMDGEEMEEFSHDNPEPSFMDGEEMEEFSHDNPEECSAASTTVKTRVARRGMSVEWEFEGKEVPSWREQLTVRAFVASFFLGIMLSFIVMKLNLTTGIIPSLNVSAGLLGFFFVKVWTMALDRSGLLRQPFTRQENTVIQTCVVATYGIAFSGLWRGPNS